MVFSVGGLLELKIPRSRRCLSSLTHKSPHLYCKFLCSYRFFSLRLAFQLDSSTVTEALERKQIYVVDFPSQSVTVVTKPVSVKGDCRLSSVWLHLKEAQGDSMS
jgi:hypothetical protein